MTTETKLAGEVWKINHQRKGKITVRLSKDTKPDDEWVYCEIVDGRPLSVNPRKIDLGKGPGDTLTFRQSFAKWVEKL